MAGNAKEASWTSAGDRRYILGGAFSEPIYMFNDADAQPPFERNATFAFRLARYPKPVRPELPAPPSRATRHQSKEHPTDETAFRINTSLNRPAQAQREPRTTPTTQP